MKEFMQMMIQFNGRLTAVEIKLTILLGAMCPVALVFIYDIAKRAKNKIFNGNGGKK